MHNVNIVVYKNFKQFCTQACHSERGVKNCVYNVYILFNIRIIKYYNNNHNNIVGNNVIARQLKTGVNIANIVHKRQFKQIRKDRKISICVQCEQL